MSSFLTTIQELEELEKKAAKVELEGSMAGISIGKNIRWVDTEPEFASQHDTNLLCCLYNNASKLLAMARWACENGYKP